MKRIIFMFIFSTCRERKFGKREKLANVRVALADEALSCAVGYFRMNQNSHDDHKFGFNIPVEQRSLRHWPDPELNDAHLPTFDGSPPPMRSSYFITIIN